MRLSSLSLYSFAALAILTSTLCLAETQGYKGEPRSSCPRLRGGLYLGGQIGYDSYRVRDRFSTSTPLVTNNHWVLNATGPVGGLFVGYGHYLHHFYYAGAEIFGNYSGADTRVNTNFNSLANYFSKLRTRGSVGISILPGIKLIDTTLGYVRLGINWVSLKGLETGSFMGSDFSNVKTHTSCGFNFGFGVETLLDGHWSARGEYTHTTYSSFNLSTDGTINHPSDNQVMFAGLYRFFI